MNVPRGARAHLAVRYRAVLAYTGLIAAFAAIPIALPLTLLFERPSEAYLLLPIGIPAAVLLLFGGAAWLWFAPRPRPALSTSEGAVVVLASWTVAVGAGAVAFMGSAGLDVTQAVFESMSAWTTTGLSVVDVEHAPETVLLLRSTLQLAGGAGLAILMLAAAAGPAGVGLASAEGREDQLVPHVRRSASIVMRLYVSYAVVGVIALTVAGMSPLDAVNHAFAAVSTGGFSTRAASIGAWDDPWIEGVTIVLMVLGATNFVTAYAAVRGRWRAVLRNPELRLTAWLLPIGAAIVFLGVAVPLHASLARGVRTAVFEVASALTTTGYSTTTYGDWPAVGWLVMIVLMVIGGGTGSTAGGLKQWRVHALWQTCRAELRRIHLPVGAVAPARTVDANGARVVLGTDIAVRTAAFAFLYLSTLVVATGVIAAYGYDLRSAFFEASSALGTVGLSVGVTASDAPPGVLWTETAAMLLGRLEFAAVILGVRRVSHDTLVFFRSKKRRAARTAADDECVRSARMQLPTSLAADGHDACPPRACVTPGPSANATAELRATRSRPESSD